MNLFFATAMLFICSIALSQPVNDDCANAMPLCPNESVSTSNISASSECNGPDGDCLSVGTWGQCYDVNNSVWFTFFTNSAGGSATVTISNISSVNPTGNDRLQGILLFAGTPCDATTYTNLDCDGVGDNNNFTLLGAGLSPNTKYWVQIDGDSVPAPQAQCTFEIVVSGPAVDWLVDTVINDVTCNGASDGDVSVTPLAGTSPHTYIWDDINSQTDAQATGLAAGTYNVTVTDSTGCETVVIVTVNEPAPMILATSSIPATCSTSDGSATVNPSNGQAPYSYNWNPSGQTTQSATNIPSGMYGVTVTDANGCTQVTTVGVSDTGGPSVNSSTTLATCNGGANGTASASPTGANPFAFLWDDPQTQTQAIATGLSAGTYLVQVTDVNGCVTVESVTVNEPTPITINTSSTDENCGSADGTATVIAGGGVPPYNYLWSPGGQTIPFISGLTAGAYTITVSDNNGCAQTETITISMIGGLSVNTSSTIVGCNGGNDGTATVTATGGTGIYTYIWDVTAGGQTTQTATGLLAGSYNVTISDSNGCTDVVSVTVYEPPAINVSSVVANANCSASDGAGTVTPSGGTSPFTFQWDTIAGSQTNSTATGLSSRILFCYCYEC